MNPTSLPLTLRPHGAVTEVSTSKIPGQKVVAPRWMILVACIVLQAAGAILVNAVPRLALVQAVALAGAGLYAAARRSLPLLLGILCYLPGAELLWRQARADIYYLTAPYLTILLAGLATFVVIGRVGRAGRLAIIYVALLIPGVLLTVKTAGPGWREIVAFALSGPIALGVLITFTSQLRVQGWMYLRFLWILLVSCVGPLAVALYGLRDGFSNIEFSDQSNFATAGGTAPVQVSALLGLGVLTAVLLVLHERDRMSRNVALAMAPVFMVQCFLTFSRGGMTAVAIALGFLAISRAGDPRMRNRIILMVAVTLGLCFAFLFPRLDELTNGQFDNRFTNSETGRTELAANDLKVFGKYFAFGVGPGMTKYQRLGYDICQIRNDKCANEGSSHTEWTRMLSEHGLAGVMAIVILLMLFLRALRESDPTSRPFVVAFLTWGIAQMFYANFRIVAVPFVLGFAFIRIREFDRPLSSEAPLEPRPGVSGAPDVDPSTHEPAPAGSTGV